MQSVVTSQSIGHQTTNNRIEQGKNNGQPLEQELSAAEDKNNVENSGDFGVSAKQQLNNSIINANLELSISSGNEPMSLLYKAAIEGINEVINAKFGDNAIQSAFDEGLDVSPEATADRIVSISTAFFSQYKEQHSELSEHEAAKSFAGLISTGIDKGFSEAKEILSGLKVFEDDIEADYDKTHTLVDEGLKAFVDGYKEIEGAEI